LKNIYIDTNVILSYYKPNEIFHNAARKILNSKRIKLISSDLTIIELCSSISRQYSQNEIKISSSAQKILEKEDEFTQIMALIKYILLSLNIEFFSNPGTQNFKLNNFKLDMCLIFYQTFYIKLDMQILDNSVYCLFQNCSVISNAKMSKQGGFPSLQSFFYSESDNFYKLIEYRSILSSIVTFP